MLGGGDHDVVETTGSGGVKVEGHTGADFAIVVGGEASLDGDDLARVGLVDGADLDGDFPDAAGDVEVDRICESQEVPLRGGGNGDGSGLGDGPDEESNQRKTRLQRAF